MATGVHDRPEHHQRLSYHLLGLLMVEAGARCGAVYRVDRSRRLELIASSPEFWRDEAVRLEVLWERERASLAAGSPWVSGSTAVVPLCDELRGVQALVYLTGVETGTKLDPYVLGRLHQQVTAITPVDLRDLLGEGPEATTEARNLALATRIRAALQLTRGRRNWAAAAARELGWSRTKLYENMRRLGIQRAHAT